MVGNEFKKLNKLNITFMEDNVFELMFSRDIFDIIIMNLFHDVDDIKCLCIVHNCTKLCNSNTKFVIIEDVLLGEFNPKEVIMHGLRLSVEYIGGRQRTIKELITLF